MKKATKALRSLIDLMLQLPDKASAQKSRQTKSKKNFDASVI